MHMYIQLRPQLLSAGRQALHARCVESGVGTATLGSSDLLYTATLGSGRLLYTVRCTLLTALGSDYLLYVRLLTGSVCGTRLKEGVKIGKCIKR